MMLWLSLLLWSAMTKKKILPIIPTPTMSALEHLSAKILISFNLISFFQMKIKREFHKMNQKQLIQREIHRELLSAINIIQEVYTLKNLLITLIYPLQINQLILHLDQRLHMLHCYCAITIAMDISPFNVWIRWQNKEKSLNASKTYLLQHAWSVIMLKPPNSLGDTNPRINTNLHLLLLNQ